MLFISAKSVILKLQATELYLTVFRLVKQWQRDFSESGWRGSKLDSFDHLGVGCCCFLINVDPQFYLVYIAAGHFVRDKKKKGRQMSETNLHSGFTFQVSSGLVYASHKPQGGTRCSLIKR